MLVEHWIQPIESFECLNFNSGRGRGMGGVGDNAAAKRIINHFHNFLYVRDTFGRMVRATSSIL
jgi:hypothetical protein